MTEIIAIDGPASVGKSSIAKKLSKIFKSPMLSSGRLYRAVALEIVKKNIKLNDSKNILKCLDSMDNNLKSKDLYSSQINELSSIISTKKYLREALKKFQLNFPQKQAKGKKFAIIEGRDISTIIFPNAKYKIFMWADAKIRAKRRYLQIKKTGRNASFISILKDINDRDKMDLGRKIAPLKPSVNSVLLDTSYLDIEQALNLILKIIKK